MMMSNDHVLHHTDCKSPQLLLSLYSYMSSQDKGLWMTNQSQPSSQKYHCTDLPDSTGIASPMPMRWLGSKSSDNYMLDHSHDGLLDLF